VHSPSGKGFRPAITKFSKFDKPFTLVNSKRNKSLHFFIQNTDRIFLRYLKIIRANGSLGYD
jgi:hypothetical protein